MADTRGDMVERVARAIWHERAKHFGEAPKPFAKDERWELCLSYARAAIEAMREPTDYMLDETVGPDAKEFEVAPVRAQWTDMIDAALKEGISVLRAPDDGRYRADRPTSEKECFRWQSSARSPL